MGGTGAHAAVVLDGGRSVQQRRAGAAAAIHDGMLAAAAQRVPGFEPSFPNNAFAYVRRSADGPHLFQPALPARVRELRAAGACVTYRHHRGQRGVRHGLSTQHNTALSRQPQYWDHQRRGLALLRHTSIFIDTHTCAELRISLSCVQLILDCAVL